MNDESKVFGITVRAFIAILFAVFACAMSGLKIPIVEPFYSAFLLTLGFFFGQKQGGINAKP